jgi:hypothetical protein
MKLATCLILFMVYLLDIITLIYLSRLFISYVTLTIPTEPHINNCGDRLEVRSTLV